MFLAIASNQIGFSSNDSINNIGVYVSYFGESITHPGLKLGMEYSIWNKTGVRNKKNGKQLPYRRELLLIGSLSGYVHPRNHVGMLLGGEIGYRNVRKKGFMYEASAGIGYLHTFLQGDTYTVNDHSKVDQVSLAGQPNLSFLLSVGIGKDYRLVHNKPWAWHIKTTAFTQYPYGSKFMYHYAMEVGVVRYINLKK